MYKNKFLKIIFFLVILNTRYLILDTAKAHAELSLGIYPPIIQIDATPPTSVRSPISIENSGDTPLNLDVQVKLFKSSPNNNGELTYLGPDDPFPGNDPDIFQKMELLDDEDPIDHLTLAPQQEKKLTLHVLLPKDEPPGDYYFSIIFLSKGESLEQNGSGITGGIATNVLLSVGPKSASNGSIKEFSSPWIVDHGPIPIKLLVNNTSSHFIVPRGNIVIRNMFGQIVGKLDLLPVNILSNSSRYIPDKKSSLPTTTYNLQPTTPSALWPERFLLGPYSIHLTLLLSESGPLFERTIYFIALPIQFSIGLLIATAIIIYIIIRIKKRMKK